MPPPMFELFCNGKTTGIIDVKGRQESFIAHMTQLRARCGEPEVRYPLKERLWERPA